MNRPGRLEVCLLDLSFVSRPSFTNTHTRTHRHYHHHHRRRRPSPSIFRDGRWGRGQETPGEDPTLTSSYIAGYVNGMQGSAKYLKVSTTCTCACTLLIMKLLRVVGDGSCGEQRYATSICLYKSYLSPYLALSSRTSLVLLCALSLQRALTPLFKPSKHRPSVR